MPGLLPKMTDGRGSRYSSVTEQAARKAGPEPDISKLRDSLNYIQPFVFFLLVFFGVCVCVCVGVLFLHL